MFDAAASAKKAEAASTLVGCMVMVGLAVRTALALTGIILLYRGESVAAGIFMVAAAIGWRS
jgi:hypothetical protein